jgi:hypothetical protein
MAGENRQPKTQQEGRIVMRETQGMKVRLLSVAAAAMFATFLATTASAQSWTTVGSTGVVDEDDAGIVEFVLGEARVPAAAAAGSVLNLRYNVVQLGGFDGPGSYLMQVRFRDNGAAARVQLDLRQYHTNGPTSTWKSFDSNAYAPSVGYQTQFECFDITLDFEDGPYFIDATLTKSGAAGQPALGIIQLIPSHCTP